MKGIIKFGLYWCILAMLSACSKDMPENTELLFDEVSATGTDNFTIAYFSYDPGCIGESYDINANALASEMVLKCRNSDNIIISKCHTSNWDLDINNDWYEKSEKLFINKAASWRMEVIDQSTIKIVIDPVDPDSYDLSYAIQSSVLIGSGDPKDKRTATFHLTRFMTSITTMESMW